MLLYNKASQYSDTPVFLLQALSRVLSLLCWSLDLRLLSCSHVLAGLLRASDSSDSAFLAQDLEPYLR